MPDSLTMREYRRNEFYQRLYPRLLRALTISIFANLALCLTGYYVVKTIPNPQFYATSARGLTLSLLPMDMPNQSEAAVTQWAIEAVITLNTFDFLNFDSEINNTYSYFTSNGWSSFMDALEASDTRAMVLNEKLIASAVVTQPPVVLAKGVIDGVYTWRIQLVILITYQVPGNEPKQVQQMVTMLIKRISTRQDPRGIGIDQILIGNQNQIGTT